MAVTATTAAWIAVGASTLGTAASIQQQRKGEKANRRAAALQRRQAEIQNMRERRKAMAAARREAAAVRARTASLGVGGSSAAEGAIGSIRSQVAERVGFSGQMEAFGSAINQQQQRAATAGTRANIYSAVGNLPSQLGMGGFSEILGGEEY